MILCRIEDGSLWCGTRAGLSRWQNGQMTSFTKEDGLPSSRIRSLAVDSNDQLWIGTRAGLARFDNGKFTVYTKKTVSPTIGSTPSKAPKTARCGSEPAPESLDIRMASSKSSTNPMA